MKSLNFLALTAVLVGLGQTRAQAQPTGEAFALIVGSNWGGQGQAALRYAEEDTARVAEVLTSLGGYRQDRVERLLQPTVSQLRAALERIRQRVQPMAANGTQSRFFFYYSGHARADALNLGAEQLPLAELRERITGLPATLSIVVLDACQSGAFSRTKGAEHAADFSFNSVERLNTTGIAVIASSNERELSQESEELKSSYFTHHWLVGLRGGGDTNADGRVTLSEAYQYAYNHTLANTAQTSVGEQHATLETNLTGQDDVALTHPATASAHLEVPATLDGTVLLQALPSWSVLAELDKVRGQPVILALPAGSYVATLRQSDRALRCRVNLRDGAQTRLDPAQCAPLQLAQTAAKGDIRAERAALRAERVAERAARAAAQALADIGKDEGWILELGLGFGSGHDTSRYISRLRVFDFGKDSNDIYTVVHPAASVGRRVHPNLVLGLGYLSLQSLAFVRTGEVTQQFNWSGDAAFGFVQGDMGLARRRMLNVFARVGAGASFASTSLDAVLPERATGSQPVGFQDTTIRTKTVTQHFLRPCGYISAGLQVMPSRYVGFAIELRYVWAPAIENLFDEVHDLGGPMLVLSFRARSWE